MSMSPDERARLEQAYRRTTYAAGLSIRLRVGEPHAFLDQMLGFRALEEWAYLTAVNPGSKPLAEDANFERMEALRAQLRGRYAIIEGVATADDGQWAPEPSVLVLGMPRAEAETLGRELGQNAILVGRRGGPAELVWLNR